MSSVLRKVTPTMLSRILIILAVCLLPLGAVASEQARLAGPVSGLVFDHQAHAIRPVIGVPGASYLGEPLAAGIDLAAVSPDGRLALAAQEGSLFLLRKLDGAQPVWSLLEEAAGLPERIVWNRASSAVAVVSTAGRLRAWRIAADETVAVLASDLSALGGRATALAVDASGSVVAGIEAEQAGGIYLVSPEGSRLLASAARPSAVALANGDRDLYVADRARQEILLLRGFRDAGAPALVANQSLGVSDPVGLAVSADGKALIVAGAADRSLLLIDLSAPAPALSIELEFEPSRVEPLPGGPLFLLNSRGAPHEPLQVLEMAPTPAVYFVPAQSNPLED